MSDEVIGETVEPEIEVALKDDAEHLFRQLHPGWVHNGRVSSQLFKVTPKDEGQLSTDRGSKTTAGDSHAAHVGMGHESISVYAVTVSEVGEVDLRAIDDPLPDRPAHALIDMRGLARPKMDGKAGRLRDVAIARGCLHPPPAQA